MTLKRIEAWSILRAQSLGEVEGAAAQAALSEIDAEALNKYRVEFLEAGQHLAELAKADLTKRLEGKNSEVHTWNVNDAYNFLDAIAGSQYQQLHLTAALRIGNAELIWDGIKP